MASSLNESNQDPPTRTKSEGDTIDILSLEKRRPTVPHVHSFTFGQKKKKLFGGRNTKKQWMFAAQKAKGLRDPWEGLGMESLSEEVVTRHMYNPRTKKWKVDEVVVKIQSEVSGLIIVLCWKVNSFYQSAVYAQVHTEVLIIICFLYGVCICSSE